MKYLVIFEEEHHARMLEIISSTQADFMVRNRKPLLKVPGLAEIPNTQINIKVLREGVGNIDFELDSVVDNFMAFGLPGLPSFMKRKIYNDTMSLLLRKLQKGFRERGVPEAVVSMIKSGVK